MKLQLYIPVLILVSLSVLLLVLDRTRAGPLSDLEKCALLLSIASVNAADVLVVGSSRTAVAVDPVAMQDMLRADTQNLSLDVERIAIPVNPIRPNMALLERYIENRGAPKVVIYEPSFLSQRSVKNLEENHGKKDAEDYIFTRDMGILTYRQIINLSSVAMPFSDNENIFTHIHLIVRGILMRSGMLIYEFFHRPFRDWKLANCSVEDWRKGGMVWSDDFEFSYAHSRHSSTSEEVLGSLATTLEEASKSRSLAGWQVGNGENEYYAYDFESDYRKGEKIIFEEVITLAKENDINLIIQPLTLFRKSVQGKDNTYLSSLGENIYLYDLYAEAGNILDRFWYDPAHILPDPAGVYTTALLANYISTNEMLYRD